MHLGFGHLPFTNKNHLSSSSDGNCFLRAAITPRTRGRKKPCLLPTEGCDEEAAGHGSQSALSPCCLPAPLGRFVRFCWACSSAPAIHLITPCAHMRSQLPLSTSRCDRLMAKDTLLCVLRTLVYALEQAPKIEILTQPRTAIARQCTSSQVLSMAT